VLGRINPTTISYLEREVISFTGNLRREPIDGEPTDTEDMLALLRQCIRYGCEYGAPYSVITDFDHCLILETPQALLLDLETKRYPGRPRDPPQQLELHWRLCKRHEARFYLGFILWKSINKFVDRVERVRRRYQGR